MNEVNKPKIGRLVQQRKGFRAFTPYPFPPKELFSMSPGLYKKARAFTEMAGAKEGETVWFSFIFFKSKEHRDEVNAKMMEEMNKQMEGKKDMSIPFDMKRMAYGGFQVEVEA